MENTNRPMRTGFVLDRKGNRLLPITHIKLVIDDDGKNIYDILGDKLAGEKCMVSNVDTYDDLPVLDSANYGAICYVIAEEKYYNYTPKGWAELTTGSSTDNSGDNEGSNESGGNCEIVCPFDDYSHIIISAEEPTEDQRNMIWVDTNSDGIVEGESDTNLLYSMLEKIQEMENEIASLRNRVKYLEENGVVVGPSNPDIPDEPGDDEEDIILLEDGSSLLLEDDSELLLEIQEEKPKPDVTVEKVISLEDGSEILLEDGTALLLEMQ